MRGKVEDITRPGQSAEPRTIAVHKQKINDDQQSALSKAVHTALYFAMFGILGFSTLAFVGYYFFEWHLLWELYSRIYLGMLVVYTWFIFLLLFWYDVRETSQAQYKNELISVIVPCYNESLRYCAAL
jgi:hypothetical protein